MDQPWLPGFVGEETLNPIYIIDNPIVSLKNKVPYNHEACLKHNELMNTHGLGRTRLKDLMLSLLRVPLRDIRINIWLSRDR